jgi:hypothetical protein
VVVEALADPVVILAYWFVVAMNSKPPATVTVALTERDKVVKLVTVANVLFGIPVPANTTRVPLGPRAAVDATVAVATPEVRLPPVSVT